MTTHGEQRLGLLTSSKAAVIMHGSAKAWAALRNELWAAVPEDFDTKVTTGPRAFGHAHEAEGAAKFWERHPDFELEEGGFHLYQQPGVLKGWLASSPDRMVFGTRHLCVAGLEIKSPTSAAAVLNHPVSKHRDQCQHGMLVTGLPVWWLVVHHGPVYVENRLAADHVWQAEYLHKAHLFHQFCYEGREVKRAKRTAANLID